MYCKYFIVLYTNKIMFIINEYKFVDDYKSQKISKKRVYDSNRCTTLLGEEYSVVLFCGDFARNDKPKNDSQ